MRIHIVARKIKMTASIKEFIENRLEKLQDYMDNIVWAQVIVSVEKKLHNAEVILHVGHQTMKAAASTDELYSAIDKVMAKMEAQIKKYKERNTDHRATEAVAADEMSTLIGPEINFTVVKDVPLKPMTKDEAVIEMEKQGFTFWLYQDKGSKQLQVIFKRMDNSYGLLQPVKPQPVKK
jgi:ribosomal subunit interface protein